MPLASKSERDRIARRSGVVFLLSVSATGLVLFVGVVLTMAAGANAVSDFISGFGAFEPSASVQPISIPQKSCPYLRLVSVAAENAGAPWRDAFQPSVDWKRFARELSPALAALDVTLAAAVPQVPDPVAVNLRAVLRDVQIGRVQLLVASSVNDYTSRSRVFEGYTSLEHAGALVGNACGVPVAPPLPF